MTDQSSFFNSYANKPVIISPNIGMPKILIGQDQEPNSPLQYHFQMNLVWDEGQMNSLWDEIENHLFAIPLFEHDPTSKKLRRGEAIMLKVKEVNACGSLMLNDEPLCDMYDLDQSRKSYLVWHDFFGKQKALYTIFVKIDLEKSPAAREWLETHPNLMFDLEQTFASFDPNISRVCYHALIISTRSNWNQLNFAQISDVHVAKRWDEFLGVMGVKADKTPDFEKNSKEEPEKKTLLRPPLRARFKNPNNYFRKFIRWANQAFCKGELDFVLITGDIIDYYLKNTIKKMKTYELEESNWDIFLRILLNDPLPLRTDVPATNIFQGEEMACPIYTVTGNHDVRVYGYPLSASTGIYRNFGISLLEAARYTDPFKKSQMKALVIDKYCLKPYYQYINPFDDYVLKFGPHTLFLLNSGSDTVLDLQSILMGNPSSLGFSKKQMKFFKNSIKKFGSKNINDIGSGFRFLVCHAPILNPVTKNPMIRKLLQMIKIRKLQPPEMFKERNLKRRDLPGNTAVKNLDFSFGTISRHRLDTLALMLTHRMIGLHGHTHQKREFRFVFSRKQSKIKRKSGEITNDPFVVYWDDYSGDYSEEFWNANLPLILQTPSISIGRYEDRSKPGTFRCIQITENKLTSIRLKNLDDLQ